MLVIATITAIVIYSIIMYPMLTDWIAAKYPNVENNYSIKDSLTYLGFWISPVVFLVLGAWVLWE